MFWRGAAASFFFGGGGAGVLLAVETRSPTPNSKVAKPECRVKGLGFPAHAALPPTFQT